LNLTGPPLFSLGRKRGPGRKKKTGPVTLLETSRRFCPTLPIGSKKERTRSLVSTWERRFGHLGIGRKEEGGGEKRDLFNMEEEYLQQVRVL